MFLFVLYLHLVAVLAAFACASYIHWGQERLSRAQTSPDVLSALRLSARGSHTMPWVGLGLLATGAYLTQSAFTWTTPWIDVSILGWIGLEITAGFAHQRHERLILALQPVEGQPLDAALAQAARDPVSRMASYLLPLLTLGIMLVMVVK